MIRLVFVVLFFLGAASIVWGQMAGTIGIQQGPRFNKYDQLGMGLGGGLTPSVSCNGVLDFSTGCAQAIPGGI